ncbi:hypothetical protein, partial [Actinomyces sp.]
KAQKNQPTTTGQPAIPTKNTQKQKTGIKNKQTHYRVHKQHPHNQAHTAQAAHTQQAICAMFPRPELLASFAAVRRNKENNTQVRADRQIMTARVTPASFSADFQCLRRFSSLKMPKNQHFSCRRTQNIKQNVCQAAQSRHAIQHADQGLYQDHLICCLKLYQALT